MTSVTRSGTTGNTKQTQLKTLVNQKKEGKKKECPKRGIPKRMKTEAIRGKRRLSGNGDGDQTACKQKRNHNPATLRSQKRKNELVMRRNERIQPEKKRTVYGKKKRVFSAFG